MMVDSDSERVDDDHKYVRIAHINAAEPGALYIIHPCAHNPTGMDPSLDEWKQIMEALIAKKCVSILDSAYQGYATGSLETDRKVNRGRHLNLHAQVPFGSS